MKYGLLGLLMAYVALSGCSFTHHKTKPALEEEAKVTETVEIGAKVEYQLGLTQAKQLKVIEQMADLLSNNYIFREKGEHLRA